MEDKRIWVAVLAVVAIIIFFGGFKYADYRRGQLEQPELIVEDPADVSEPGPASGEENEPAVVMVHVAGAVENPGVFQMREGERVFQALEKARPTAEADTNQLNLAQVLVDQDKVVVPRRGETLEEVSSLAAGGITHGQQGAAGGKVNLNTASVSELDERLPGIGPALAQRIVEYRQQNGGFKTPEQITEVSGIGDKRYEQIKDLLTVR